MAKKSFDILSFPDLENKFNHIFLFISTQATNATNIAIEVEAFDDWKEVEYVDDEVKEEMKEMGAGDVTYNENSWLVVCVK